jgi:hypothetical protein
MLQPLLSKQHSIRYDDLATVVAVRELVYAHECSVASASCRWQFAVELEELRRQGLTTTDIRWLVFHGLLEHAVEVTPPGAVSRSFKGMGQIKFEANSCFVLTDKALDQLGESESDHQSACRSTGKGSQSEQPVWIAARHELVYRGLIVKRFKVPSPNQEIIINVFDEEGWPLRIEDPLPPCRDQLPRCRLNDTIRSLNRHQKHRLILFSGDGTGEGVLWERITTEMSRK